MEAIPKSMEKQQRYGEIPSYGHTAPPCSHTGHKIQKQ